MRKNTKIPVAIGIIAAILLFAASFNLYYLRDDSGGQLLWNADEAYLFMTVARRGVRLSYLEYRTVLKEWLNAPAFPTNQRVFLSVIRVTPSGIERHVGKVVGETADIPDFFTPLDKPFIQTVRELRASGSAIISRMQHRQSRKCWMASITLLRTSI